MRHIILSFFLCLIAAISYSQKIDSLIAIPQTIELSISTPQPRLKETFQLTLDIRHIRANIFKSQAGKIQVSSDAFSNKDGLMVMNVNALKKGTNEIGPLEFTLDKTKYTTNKITFEVVDALPDTDDGLWFRKVDINDSTFCIIIEQRIPSVNKTVTSNKSVTYKTVPKSAEFVKFKDNFASEGLRSFNSQMNSSFSSIKSNGEERKFMNVYSVYYFKRPSKKNKMKITKENLENLPDDYNFENIIIQ